MDAMGGGEFDDGRTRLWERLLAGELTRVSVTCSYIGRVNVFEKYIPHSLGLERIWPYAYQQDRKTGAWRTIAQYSHLARVWLQ
jgi:hypothetical protein